MPDPNIDSLSESEEMYILTILNAGDEGRQVPVAEVAEALAVQPVSANQMIRKLETGGYLDYEPYKGVSLRPRGRAAAARVLRRRRVWLAFLANELGLAIAEADAFACRLEHITPAAIIDRLYEHVGRPAADPLGRPIPASAGTQPGLPALPLAELPVGRPLVLGAPPSDAAAARFLARHALAPGVEVEILVRGEDSLLLRTPGGQVEVALSIAAGLAACQKEGAV